MKVIKLFTCMTICIFSLQFSEAQSSLKKESIIVYGNCGMCKKKIEASAKAGGASTANWNSETKKLNIVFNPAISSSAKIQTAIANAGYDTRDIKGNDSAYDQLNECCKYERKLIANLKTN